MAGIREELAEGIDAVRFIRYSAEPPSEVREPVIQDGSDHRGSKPNGMWFSIVNEDGRDSWADYCKGRGRATLPDTDQEEIGRRLLSHVEKLRQLRAEVDKGIRSLDAGKGRPFDVEDLLRQKNKRRGRG